jgi:hypothetical protein
MDNNTPSPTATPNLSLPSLLNHTGTIALVTVMVAILILINIAAVWMYRAHHHQTPRQQEDVTGLTTI